MGKRKNTFYSSHIFLYPLEISPDAPEFSKKKWVEENRWKELEKSKQALLAKDVKDFETDSLDVYRDKLEGELLWNTYRYFLPAVQNQLFPKPDADRKANGEKCLIRHYRYQGLTGYHDIIWKALEGQADERQKKEKKEKKETLQKKKEKLRDYCFPNLDDSTQYRIKTAAGEVFILRLTGIHFIYLETYHMGVLRFETVYLGEKELGGKEVISRTLFADAKAINDLGRRVYSPCYDTSGTGKVITTAKEITLYLAKGKKDPLTIQFPSERETDALPLFRELLFGNRETDALPLFRKLLFRKDRKKPEKIRGILDDRMYTVCLIQDAELSGRIAAGQVRDTDLYELAFVDQDTNCSCRSKKMLKKAMEAHTYSRWEGYGTLQFVTEYAMTCVTGLNLEAAVVNPFRTMYVEMLQLALLQRAVLVRLEREAEEIAEKIELGKVKSLWKDYIHFQNTLSMREVTFQQQGVELYDMMKRDLRILEIGDDLGRKITRFESYSEITQEENQTAVSGAFTDIALIGTVHTILASNALGNAEKCPQLVTYGLCLFGIGFVLAKLTVGICKMFKQGFRRNKWNFFRSLVYIGLIAILLALYGPQIWSRIEPLLSGGLRSLT